MEQITKEELTIANAKELTVAQAAELLNQIEQEPDKEKRSAYAQMLGSAFEFRSISARSRNLKHDLSFYGYQFFPIANNTSFIRGVRKFGNNN